MAHRLYVYNVSLDKDFYDTQLIGEWNYVIPIFFFPLFSNPITKEELKNFGIRKNKDLYFNIKKALPLFKEFHQWLVEEHIVYPSKLEKYQTAYEKQLHYFENLPYDYILLDASDVYNMQVGSHKKQSEELSLSIDELIHEFVTTFNYAYGKEYIENTAAYTYHFGTGASLVEHINNDYANYGWDWLEKDQSQLDLDYFVFEDNGLFGLKNYKGEIITPPIYEYINDFEEGAKITIYQENNLYGFIDKKGNIIIPAKFDDVRSPHINYIFDQDNQDTHIEEYLAPVCTNEHWGLINIETQSYIIPSQHKDIELINATYYNVFNGSKYAIFDEKGKQCTNFTSSSLFEYHYSHFCSQNGEKYSFYSPTFNYLGEFNYADVEESYVKDTLLIPSLNYPKKKTLIDYSANVILDDLVSVSHLTDQNILVNKGAEKGIFNLKSKQYTLEPFRCKVEQYTFYDINLQQHQLYFSHGKKKGIYDSQSQRWVVPYENFDYIKVLNNNKATVKLNEKWALIDFDQQVDTFVYDCNFITLHKIFDEQEVIIIYKDDTVYSYKNNQYHSISNSVMLLLYSILTYDTDQEYALLNNYFQRVKSSITIADYQPISHFKINWIREKFLEKEEIALYDQLLFFAEELNHSDLLQDLGYKYLTEPDYLDYNKALKLFHIAEQHNNPYSITNIGYMYEYGLGTEIDIKKALEYYEKGAELGNETAKYNAAIIYYFGQGNIENDFNKALYYFKRIKNNDNYIEDYIADCYYLLGEYNNALRHIKKDIKQEDRLGSLLLGRMHCYGYGVTKDVRKAIPLLEKAIQNNCTNAIYDLIHIYAHEGDAIDQEKLAYYLNLLKENKMELPEEYQDKNYLSKLLGKWFKK
ncbi:SEL1-like repeat protein [Myroides sp. LoEW2-1]|uniref:SEL1-like repeat protein n=1 Tax=Myroides sp. LoEW2-1 TaxID=2683192 RepID=UPI00132BE91C|nr:SEL1-like repeat protein [Myroides sp. LoEW2-1]MVX35886.1 hypothetical protein [Myroides sp. LoEW2-1]